MAVYGTSCCTRLIQIQDSCKSEPGQNRWCVRSHKMHLSEEISVNIAPDTITGGSMSSGKWWCGFLSIPVGMGAAIIFLWVMFAVIASAGASEILTMRLIEPLPTSIEPLYYRIAIGYPEVLRDGAFHFYVNGKEMPFETLGSDSGVLANPRMFRVYMGAPGHKRIEVILTKGQSALRQATEIDFRSKGGMVLLGHFDGESLFEGTEEVSILTYFMRETRVRVNGQPIPVQSEPIEEMDGGFQLTFMPGLRPGMNIIEYSGIDNAGRKFLRRFSIFSVKDGKVKIGDRINYIFGYPKANEADPEFHLKITGTALAKSGAFRKMTMQGISEVWLSRSNAFFMQPMVARKAGVSTIKIMATYSTGFQHETSQVITVEPHIQK
jgi:hypothetical protein